MLIYIHTHIYIYKIRTAYSESHSVKNAVSHPLDCNEAYADNYQLFSYIATRILMYLQVSKRKLYNVRLTVL
jgi:hypothetical protein